MRKHNNASNVTVNEEAAISCTKPVRITFIETIGIGGGGAFYVLMRCYQVSAQMETPGRGFSSGMLSGKA